MQKIKKTCKFVYAHFCLLQKTNKDLLTAAYQQQQRATRIKDHWNIDKVINLDVVEKRVEKTRSKVKDKKNKQINKELNQTIKVFFRLDSLLFMKVKQRSSVKFTTMISSWSILLSSTLISLVKITSLKSVRKHRKQIQMSFKGVKQIKEMTSDIRMSCSERIIKPSRNRAWSSFKNSYIYVYRSQHSLLFSNSSKEMIQAFVINLGEKVCRFSWGH